MNRLFEPLADSLGASVDQVKVITCLLISYPLASLYTRVHDPTSKHLFSILVSIFFLVGVFQLWQGTLQLLCSIVFTYTVSATMQGRKMPWIVFFGVMGHLTANHLYRAYYEISLSVFEITGPQMVLTMKLTTFAWNVYDGRQPLESLDKWQAEKRIIRYPSLLEFLGYAFYFPGMLIGPSLEYANYLALAHDSVVADSGSEDEVPKRRKFPPGRKRYAYGKMLQGLISLALFVFYGGKFNYTVMLDDWWLHKSWLYQLGYMQLIGFFERTKYYSIWSLTEGSAIISGLGFTGFSPSGSSKWDGAANVNIRNIELAPNFKVLLDSWNIKTNVWLRECMYKRITPRGQKPGFSSSMMTFATSAFWHGIAGGYYLTFVFGGFMQTAQRSVRTLVRPLMLPPLGTPTVSDQRNWRTIKFLYDVAGTLTTILLLNYAVIPFILLDLRSSIEGWRRAYWYGHFIIGASLIFFRSGAAKYLMALQAKRVLAAAEATRRAAEGKSMSTTPGLLVPPIHVLAN